MADQDLLHTAEIVKAALPFIDSKSRVTAELFVKVFELMGSLKTMKSPDNMAACGFESDKIDFEGLLNGIRPLLSGKERTIIDRILNFFNMKRMFEMYNNMMEAMKTMQEFGGFPFGDSDNSDDAENVTGNFNSPNFESIFQTMKAFNSAGSGSESNANPEDNYNFDSEYNNNGGFGSNTTASDTNSSDNAECSGNKSNDMMFEMLKGMIPPEKKSTFENLSMLLNTMSYDINSKPDENEESKDG